MPPHPVKIECQRTLIYPICVSVHINRTVVTKHLNSIKSDNAMLDDTHHLRYKVFLLIFFIFTCSVYLTLISRFLLTKIFRNLPGSKKVNDTGIHVKFSVAKIGLYNSIKYIIYVLFDFGNSVSEQLPGLDVCDFQEHSFTTVFSSREKCLKSYETLNF